ncbi:MAG: lycopene cyclase family protein, partial [Fulvivirga sp.]|uniref:lycopene cyclase family protein n=1 Tax=Fulvivirga sp. TaxID=1931237 RepID=UPI0032EBC63F
MGSTIYDYAIIGAGAAGLQLALALSKDAYFNDHKILVIEKEGQRTNDKTWCFWEEGSGKWDHIITRSWNNCQVIASDKRKKVSLGLYAYKMIEAINFYNYAEKELRKTSNIEFVHASVEQVKSHDTVEIKTDSRSYHAKHIFDSRISDAFFNKDDKSIRILQHFRGWLIKTENSVFDDTSFTMMDFSVKWPETTSFMYVLPISKHEALVEYTFFSSNLANEEDYDKMIRHYIEDVLAVGNYDVKNIESGVIPMSNYPFYKHNTKQITKIGTAGGWVRPSSGYSFKNAEKACNLIIDNLKKNRRPSSGIFKMRFAFYDSIFLKVLEDHNYLGEKIFYDMYFKNDIGKILKFLDQDSTIFEELKIISSF